MTSVLLLDFVERLLQETLPLAIHAVKQSHLLFFDTDSRTPVTLVLSRDAIQLAARRLVQLLPSDWCAQATIRRDDALPWLTRSLAFGGCQDIREMVSDAAGRRFLLDLALPCAAASHLARSTSASADDTQLRLSRSHGDTIPVEIWLNCIFPRLRSLQDFVACCQVSKHFYSLITDDLLWRHFFFMRWNICPLRGVTPLSWRQLYSFLHLKFLSSKSCTTGFSSAATHQADDGTLWYPVDQLSLRGASFQPVIFNTCIIGNQSTIFEFRVFGLAQVGIVTSDFFSTIVGYYGVGDDFNSYSFDGERRRLFHDGYCEWGRRWQNGNILGIGVSVSPSDIRLEYFLQGESMGVGHIINRDSTFSETNKMQGIDADELKGLAAIFPAISFLGSYSSGRLAINPGPKLSFQYPAAYAALAATSDWTSLVEQYQPSLTIVRQKIPYSVMRDQYII